MQSFVMALRSISANKMRAVLTMLGIIIGVMALVVLVSLVNGATTSVTDKVAELGSSMVSATILDDKGKPIRLSDLDQWMEQDPDLGLLAPYKTSTLVGKHGGNYDSVTIYGTTAAYYDIQNMQLSLGRWLKNTDITNNSYVCVINHEAATELIGFEDCVGQSLTLGGTEFTIIGVLVSPVERMTEPKIIIADRNSNGALISIKYMLAFLRIAGSAPIQRGIFGAIAMVIPVSRTPSTTATRIACPAAACTFFSSFAPIALAI